MLDRYNKRLQSRRDREHRSQLEQDVEQALQSQGYQPQYETEKFPYVLHRKYTPDFRVGDVYVEVKGWWPSAERAKFLSVIFSNPDLPIFVALQRPLLTLSKQSKTTYAQWCSKHGIAWCPIPIPPDFMARWMNGERVTSPVPTATVAAPTQQQPIPMDPSIASPASADTTLTDQPGRAR